MDSVVPCRHAGAPPTEIVDLTTKAIGSIASDEAFLRKNGLTKEEFDLALPAAIERIRGRSAASNSDRREFLLSFLKAMERAGLVEDVRVPERGKDTVYRVTVPSVGVVAIIQKGCPDGKHSSVEWSVPDWADETYLWWVCDSLGSQPGVHVAKGVGRLRNRFFDAEYNDAIDGIIFHNSLCGSAVCPCPKMPRAIDIGELKVPPPCIWVMPQREDYEAKSGTWNWEGLRKVGFPEVLMSFFGVSTTECQNYVGYVGFAKGVRGIRTTIASRNGIAESNSFRSDSR